MNKIRVLNQSISKVSVSQPFHLLSDAELSEVFSVINTDNMLSANEMFAGYYNLETAPMLNTHNVKDMSYMFVDCDNLKTVPLYDTSSVTNMRGMFKFCSKLTSVPAFDMSSVENAIAIFWYCHKLTSIKFYGIKVSFSVAETALTRNAIVELFNNLGTPSERQKITLGSTKLALLSDREKAIATNKNWTLA